MSIGGFDPEILQDFLTESGELLDQLEGDLVSLETSPEDLDLVNQVFRALHTIKGSASFLALTNLVEIAHAAETSLNAARAGEFVIDRRAMDLLLEAIDLLKKQFDELRAGKDLTAPAAELVRSLTDLGNASAALAQGAPAPDDETRPAPSPGQHPSTAPLSLAPGREDLLDFLVSDLVETLQRADELARQLAEEASRSEACNGLAEVGDALVRSIDFFEVDSMTRLARALVEVGEQAGGLPLEIIDQLTPRVRGMIELLQDQTAGLGEKTVRNWPIDTLLDHIGELLHGAVPDGAQLAPGASPPEALIADGAYPPEATPESLAAADGSILERKMEPMPVAMPTSPAPPQESASESQTPSPRTDNERGDPKESAKSEQTIRVEVGRLETLMNLVGELVLQKNRITELGRRFASAEQADPEQIEALTTTAGTLDRVTSDIQVAVMRTRMQPLDKIFGRYPRLIRDLARKTNKDIRLEIVGGDTEVDKSVIEELGDPMVHLLRNAGDHGVEPPEDREAAGKPKEGVIRILANHEGSHVTVRIEDDGRGLRREIIGAKAVERGLTTEAELANLSDRDIFRFIFAPGFSTAAQVSDISGRGVGMDVVRTNIERLNGTIEVDSVPGAGTTILIKIPLTIAIMPAMMVGVADEIYAIPLSNIVEIVRPDPAVISTIREHPVMRLRDSILPLVSAAEVFDIGSRAGARCECPFAVVLTLNEKRVGLMVTKLIGQQEIVIKPLDSVDGRKTGPISGATVRNDGGVSLIVDVEGMVRLAEQRIKKRATEPAALAA